MENQEQKPINKTLIFLTFLFVSFATIWGYYDIPKEPTMLKKLTMVLAIIVTSPIFVLWLQSIYNEIVPRISNFRKIEFWEAFGLWVLIMFVF